MAFSYRLGLEGMGQLRHVHHALSAQHLGHALAPPIRQPGPTVRNSLGHGLGGWGETIGLKAGRVSLDSAGKLGGTCWGALRGFPLE